MSGEIYTAVAMVVVALIGYWQARATRKRVEAENEVTRLQVQDLHNEVRTNDGRRAGDYIEMTAKELAATHMEARMARALAEQVAEEVRRHDATDKRAFAYLNVPEEVLQG